MRTPQPVRQVPGQHADHRHINDVRAQGHDAAVLEDEGLDHQNRGHHHRRRRRTQHDGHQRAANQVCAGAQRDREVDHLRGEDKGSHDPHQRNLASPGCLWGSPFGRGEPPGRRREDSPGPKRTRPGYSEIHQVCASPRSLRLPNSHLNNSTHANLHLDLGNRI